MDYAARHPKIVPPKLSDANPAQRFAAEEGRCFQRRRLSACGKPKPAETSDVAGMAGFEPTISESKSGVLPLHYIPISGQKSSGIGITPNPRFRGVGKGVRTLDTRNHNPVLSRLSYTHHRSEMVRQEGFEPPAYCLEGSCSIQLSYWRACNIWLPAQKVWSG